LANAAIALIVLGFVLHSSHATTKASSSPLSGSDNISAPASPLDQLSSADIALTVARMSSLPESTAITNQAQSQAADLATAASNNDVVSKPQVVTTALKSRANIQDYTTVAGDTVESVATKFGVTSDSIRLSNNLTGDGLTAGQTLVIPPVNGVVYTVKAGDTVDSIASQFHADKDQLVAFNDGEISGFTTGEQIIVPNGTQQQANTAAAIAGAAGLSFPWGGSGPIYGYNGYDYGYCTWYVATQIKVPANWGNAATWAYYARLSGWNVGKAPSPGSIAWRRRPCRHRHSCFTRRFTNSV
jgi:LysM repeat protein